MRMIAELKRAKRKRAEGNSIQSYGSFFLPFLHSYRTIACNLTSARTCIRGGAFQQLIVAYSPLIPCPSFTSDLRVFFSSGKVPGRPTQGQEEKGEGYK